MMSRKPVIEIGRRYPHAVQFVGDSWQRINEIRQMLKETKALPREVRIELGWINHHALNYAQLANRSEARSLRTLAATARGILSRVGGVRGKGAGLIKR